MDIEIFLSKLADKTALYTEVSGKLGIDSDNYDDLVQKLSDLSKPTSAALYVSDEDIQNDGVDELVKAFETASSSNEKLSITVTVDEFLNLIDDEERITTVSKPRSLVHRDGDLHPTVHVWIVEHKDMGVYVLLQKRSAEKLLHPECYDVSAAGHVTQGGEYRESAVREIREELGLEVSPQSLEFIGMTKNSVKSGDKLDNEYNAVYLYSEDVDIDTLVLQKEEVAGVYWAEIDELLVAMKNGSFKHCISARELEFIKKAVF